MLFAIGTYFGFILVCLVGLLQVQVAEIQRWLGDRVGILLPACAVYLHDRPSVYDARLHDARVIQHTIQLTPRLSEPTLVTAVLVEPDVPVKKGQPLFQFDRRPYEYQVQHLEAQLAAAKQQVQILGAD